MITYKKQQQINKTNAIYPKGKRFNDVGVRGEITNHWQNNINGDAGVVVLLDEDIREEHCTDYTEISYSYLG